MHMLERRFAEEQKLHDAAMSEEYKLRESELILRYAAISEERRLIGEYESEIEETQI